MSDILIAARKKFEGDRSRAEKRIDLTVQQLDRLAAHLGERPVAPATRTEIERLLLPDDQLADFIACIDWVREEPARKAAAEQEARIRAEERATTQQAIADKLGVTVEQLLTSLGG